MRVCVVGTGYVGLVSGACLAEIGHQVTCVDVDPAKVAQINGGEAPIFEDGLAEILARNIGTRLTATTDLAAAFRDADVALICVGTPFDGKTIDLSYVIRVAEQLGALLRERAGYCVIAVKSTVIPGTTDGPVRAALERASGKRAGVDFGLGMNPEFLAEGVAVRDFMQPDRIVVGGIDERSSGLLAALYAPFPSTPLIRTGTRTAEAIKYTSNALLATLISFSNEIARYCESVGDVDVTDVLKGVHYMKHLSYRGAAGEVRQVSAASFLWAGCGFGGSCFPKDVRALIADAARHGADTTLLQAVMDLNDSQPGHTLDLLRQACSDLKGRRITVLGLAFKPGTDDVRESPALPMIQRLVAEGARVTCHDPIAMANARAALLARNVPVESLRFEDDMASAVAGAEVIVLVTSWPEYLGLPALLAARGQDPIVVDGRRYLGRNDVARYIGIGLTPDNGGESGLAAMAGQEMRRG